MAPYVQELPMNRYLCQGEQGPEEGIPKLVGNVPKYFFLFTNFISKLNYVFFKEIFTHSSKRPFLKRPKR